MPESGRLVLRGVCEIDYGRVDQCFEVEWRFLALPGRLDGLS